MGKNLKSYDDLDLYPKYKIFSYGMLYSMLLYKVTDIHAKYCFDSRCNEDATTCVKYNLPKKIPRPCFMLNVKFIRISTSLKSKTF